MGRAMKTRMALDSPTRPHTVSSVATRRPSCLAPALSHSSVALMNAVAT